MLPGVVPATAYLKDSGLAITDRGFISVDKVSRSTNQRNKHTHSLNIHAGLYFLPNLISPVIHVRLIYMYTGSEYN